MPSGISNTVSGLISRGWPSSTIFMLARKRYLSNHVWPGWDIVLKTTFSSGWLAGVSANAGPGRMPMATTSSAVAIVRFMTLPSVECYFADHLTLTTPPLSWPIYMLPAPSKAMPS